MWFPRSWLRLGVRCANVKVWVRWSSMNGNQCNVQTRTAAQTVINAVPVTGEDKLCHISSYEALSSCKNLYFTLFFTFFFSRPSHENVTEQRCFSSTDRHDGQWTQTCLQFNTLSVQMCSHEFGDVFVLYGHFGLYMMSLRRPSRMHWLCKRSRAALILYCAVSNCCSERCLVLSAV